MAKKSAINRDQKRRKLAAQYATKRAKLKAMTTDLKIPVEERFNAQLKLSELPRNSSKTRIHNRCEITGRSKSYYRKLRMSRIALRDFASNGQIPGMVKSSW
ncbi:MAG: 30S ribosomal protein S14 [Parvibaculum sp.]|jgi:small subunit ribosomal protein S14|uniref:30S ribosomal protein S14 n=1 Tax=Parvibaculum sp. TaxID=2024848 RepID=UPI0025E7792B|nr:30S ribosomal protein S14 [Parvibaculum sp.]MCE9649018.1 30S ribosomal protein S14 [Parvibaculum sp.]